MARQFDVPGLKALGLSPSDFATQAPLLQTASVTLNNDQIIALPTTPFIIVPATETLNYSGFPTKLFMSVLATGIWDSSAGAYDNIDFGTHLALQWGSAFTDDFVIAVAASNPNYGASTQTLVAENFGNFGALKIQFQFLCLQKEFIAGSIHDNSLTVFLSNSVNLTGGNSANTLKIIVYYVTVILG